MNTEQLEFAEEIAASVMREIPQVFPMDFIAWIADELERALTPRSDPRARAVVTFLRGHHDNALAFAPQELESLVSRVSALMEGAASYAERAATAAAKLLAAVVIRHDGAEAGFMTTMTIALLILSETDGASDVMEASREAADKMAARLRQRRPN
jgi:hypothetical protein